MEHLTQKILVKNIDIKEGYLKTKLFSDNDINNFRQIILNNLNEIITKNTQYQKSNINFSNYIQKSTFFDHSKLMIRKNRLFKKKDISTFYKSDGYKKLIDLFTNLEITNEVENGDPEIVWRIVRPNKERDAADFHADQWFFDINKWKIKKGKRLIKIWTLLEGHKDSYGLKIIPFSNLPYSSKYKIVDDFIKKPQIINRPDPENVKFINTHPGETILFNYNLIHAGCKAIEDKIRVSFEFTVSVQS